jgi:site-specific DNA-methyltransferase (adenine-specific)
MAVAIEDSGFEIRDQIMWIYGSGFPKSMNIGKSIDKKLGAKRKVIGKKSGKGGENLNKLSREGKGDSEDATSLGAYGVGAKQTNIEIDITEPATPEAKQWDGWGTALKPAHEPVVMARKPLSEKTIVANVLKHGTGGINIDGCRVGNEERTHRGMSSLGVMHDDNWKPSDIESTSIGRFPSNVMHDGSDVVKEVFPKRKTTNRKSRSDDNVFTNENSGMENVANHYADADPRGRFPANVMHDGSDVVKEVFPTTSKHGSVNHSTNPKTHTDSMGKFNETTSFVAYDDEGSAARYFYSPKVSKKERNHGVGVKNVHPTVKPVELMKYLCRMVTPKDGTVLDPFMGSGSTGMAAKYEGFDFIGIEREKEYFEIATSRIDSVEVPSTLEKFL